MTWSWTDGVTVVLAVSLGAYHMDLLDLVGARAHGF